MRLDFVLLWSSWYWDRDAFLDWHRPDDGFSTNSFELYFADFFPPKKGMRIEPLGWSIVDEPLVISRNALNHAPIRKNSCRIWFPYPGKAVLCQFNPFIVHRPIIRFAKRHWGIGWNAGAGVRDSRSQVVASLVMAKQRAEFSKTRFKRTRNYRI